MLMSECLEKREYSIVKTAMQPDLLKKADKLGLKVGERVEIIKKYKHSGAVVKTKLRLIAIGRELLNEIEVKP